MVGVLVEGRFGGDFEVRSGWEFDSSLKFESLNL